MGKHMFAAGRWPRGFYVERIFKADADPETTERIFVGGNHVGELHQVAEPRLAYEHHGEIRCGWCDRPLEDCRQEPCDHYSKEAEDAEAAD